MSDKAKPNSKKLKFFRVATEGATTDGRKIERTAIEQIAKNYDPQKYGARVWLEHIRGVLPDSPFQAYGDVLAVETRTVDDGKLALFAQIDATPALVAMNSARQKIYSSIEIDLDFAKTGEAYLVGVAVTDSPASLGTEMLAFRQSDGTHPFSSRKQKPDNLFSESVEVTVEYEPDEGSGLFNKVKELLSFAKKTTEQKGESDEALLLVAESQNQLAQNLSSMNDEVVALSKENAELKQSLEQLKGKFSEVLNSLETEPSGATRPAVTGGSNTFKTDC